VSDSPDDERTLVAPEHVRGPERRSRSDRRQPWTPARESDAQVRRARIAWLNAFLRGLPAETLWVWIDGLWLGGASDAALDHLVEAAIASGDPHAVAPRKPPGRPRAKQLLATFPPVPNAEVYDGWCALTRALTHLSAARKRHHAVTNRTRRGGFRSLEWRTACLASPIGEAVEGAGLFVEFFDRAHLTDKMLTPQQMAARLLHHREAQRLRDAEAHARSKAQAAPTAARRQSWVSRATKAAQQRERLGSWKTLYTYLKKYAR
jgi:hypothetical protein